MRINSKLKACAIAVALAAVPMFAQSAGLGRLNVLSGLGQPLRAEIDLVSVQPGELDSLKASLAAPDAYREAQIDYPPTSLGLRFSVEKRANGQPYISVVSVASLNEPFMDFLLELKWDGGRVLREYTALLDPVGYSPLKQPDAPVSGRNTGKPAPKAAPADKSPAPAEASAPAPHKADTPKPESQKAQASKTEPKAAETAAQAGEYEVKTGDTLASIAKSNAKEGVSLEQMLVAIYRSNPDAFDGNMNRLKKGKLLKLPEKDAAQAITRDAALQEIKVQADDWRNYRGKLADRAQDKGHEAEPNHGAGKITAKVEDKAAGAQAKSKDTLKISKGDDAKSLKEKLQVLQAESAAREKSLAEANQRVTELEQNIKKMEALLALKNKQSADLQKQAQEKPKAAETSTPTPAKPAATPTPTPKAAESKPTPTATPTPTPTPTPVASTPTPKPAESKPEEHKPAASKPEEHKQADAKATPPVKKPPKVAPPPPPPPEESLLDNPLVTFGGGGLLAALIGAGAYFGLKRRRKPGFEDSIITGSDLKSNTVVGNTGGGVISTGVTENSFLTDFSREGLGTIDTDEVDPIAEAEVYMAYGRDAQAEEILKDALARDGSRQEVRLKLLEIYSSRKNAPAFENVAKELHNATQGAGPLWAQAAEMGRSIDAGNPLYSPLSVVETTSLDKTLVSSAGMAAGLVDTTRLNKPVVGTATPAEAASPIDLDFQLDTETEAATSGPADAAPADDLNAGLDFDLDASQNAASDFDFESPADSAPVSVDSFDLPVEEPAAESTPSAQDDLSMGLDFPMSDFSLDTPGQTDAASDIDIDAPPTLESVAEPSFEAQPDDDLMTLDIPLEEPVVATSAPSDDPFALPTGETSSPDIDLGLGDDPFAMPDLGFNADLPLDEPTPTASQPVEPPELTEEDDGNAMSFDFDLDTPAPAPSMADDTPAQADKIEPSFDLGDLNLDLDAGSEITLDGGDLDFGAELDDPVTTKIDLARAYIDMGDKEGAREILQEAISEGTPEQRGIAESLLANL